MIERDLPASSVSSIVSGQHKPPRHGGGQWADFPDFNYNSSSVSYLGQGMLTTATLARFMANVRINPDTDCWLWVGNRDKDGYPLFRPDPSGPEKRAHRIAFEHHFGPIPEGMQLDHLCHTWALVTGECGAGPCLHRRCVCPEHLEAVTVSENTLRSDHAERRKTHCPMGHEYKGANTIMRGGKRFCRECRKRWRTPKEGGPDHW
jgi:HNH endonuclease